MELLRSIQLEALPTSKQPSHSTKKLDFDSALDSDSILELGIELTRLDTAASLSNRRSSFSLPQVDGKSAESWKFLGAAFILEA